MQSPRVSDDASTFSSTVAAVSALTPAGLVMTARHCNHAGDNCHVRFKDRTVSATQASMSVAKRKVRLSIDCEGSGYPHLPVAASPPRIGERLWSYGYPQVHGRRELALGEWTASMRWSTFQYNATRLLQWQRCCICDGARLERWAAS